MILSESILDEVKNKFQELHLKFCGSRCKFDEVQDDSNLFWFDVGVKQVVELKSQAKTIEAQKEIINTKDRLLTEKKDKIIKLKLQLKAVEDFLKVCN